MLRALGVAHVIGGEFERALADLIVGPCGIGAAGHSGSPAVSDARPHDAAALLDEYAGLMHGGERKIGRLHGSQPRMQASLPPLPDRAGLRGPIPRCAARRGAGGYPPADCGGRAAHHVRRSRFLQWAGARAGDRRGVPARVSGRDLRRHDQDRTPAETSRCFAGSGAHGVSVHHQRGRIARRWRARAAGKGPHAGGFRGSAGADAGARIDHGPDLCFVHAVDDARRCIWICCGRFAISTWWQMWRRSSWRSGCSIPAGSKMLELADFETGEFDPAALSWRWQHPDPEMDRLCSDLQKLVRAGDRRGASRTELFEMIWERAFGRAARISICRTAPRFRI